MPSPYEAKLQRHRNKTEDVTTCVATATSCHRHGNASYLSTRSHVHSCPRLSPTSLSLPPSLPPPPSLSLPLSLPPPSLSLPLSIPVPLSLSLSLLSCVVDWYCVFL